MTLYITDTSTGEMTPLDLSPLRTPPKGTVRRLPNPRPVRTTARRRQYRRRKPVVPLNDFLAGLAALVVAFAILLALSVPLVR